MELLFILALIGMAYCVYSSAPPAGRLVEAAAVAATLGLVAYAQQTHHPLAISLPASILAAIPIWLICFKVRGQIIQRDQKISKSTSQLWQEWDKAKNVRCEPLVQAKESLAQRLQQHQPPVAKRPSKRPARAGKKITKDPAVSPADTLPAAKLRKLNGLPAKAANTSTSENTSTSRFTDPFAELELTPMDECRYQRRV